jgi:hypothetical protein
MKRKNPATSSEAWRSFNPNKLNELHGKILAALEHLGPSTYEDVADFLKLEPQRIWRRMSELGFVNRIHRPDERKIMKSGRQGMVWILGPCPEVVKKKERVMKGSSVSDFSKAILRQPKPSQQIQQSLF